MESKKQLIEKINNQLINDNKEINIIEYAKLLNNELYKIDISFLEYFISLIDKDDCCIHYKKLEEYGIYKFDNSNKFLKKMIKNEFEEGIDYIKENANVGGQDLQHGGNNKINYYLSPRCMKILLMRSLKTKKFAYYYLFLEEIIKYFSDYQIQKLNHNLEKHKSSIYNLNNEIHKEIVKQDKLFYTIDELENNMKPGIYAFKITLSNRKDYERTQILRSTNFDYIATKILKLEDNEMKTVDTTKIFFKETVANINIFRNYIHPEFKKHLTPAASTFVYYIDFELACDRINNIVNDCNKKSIEEIKQ